MKKIIITFLLYSTVYAQMPDPTIEKLDSLFTLIETQNKGMGSISIHKDAKAFYQKSIGYATLISDTKNNSSTKYRIGSITKTFTATIIMMLIEENKLSLKAHLSDYFPEIHNADKITIEHLLRHRSGLYNITNHKDFAKWRLTPQTRKQMLDRIFKSESLYTPNTRTEYSNTNYLLLTYIAEDIMRKSYKEILKERIIIPCQLKNTYYGDKINSENNEAESYKMKTNWILQKETDMSVPAGAGGIVSTPDDINMFYHYLFSGMLVSETSLRKMKTLVEDIGMGILRFPFKQKKIYGHNGTIDGFSTIAIYSPQEKLGITYLSNATEIPISTILVLVLKMYYGLDYELFEFKPSIKLKSEELDLYIGTYEGDVFPFEIQILKNKEKLVAKAKDGPTFSLEAFEKNKFRAEQMGIVMEFFPKRNMMMLDLQGNNSKFLRR